MKTLETLLLDSPGFEKHVVMRFDGAASDRHEDRERSQDRQPTGQGDDDDVQRHLGVIVDRGVAPEEDPRLTGKRTLPGPIDRREWSESYTGR